MLLSKNGLNLCCPAPASRTTPPWVILSISLSVSNDLPRPPGLRVSPMVSRYSFACFISIAGLYISCGIFLVWIKTCRMLVLLGCCGV